jgi:hypothetical protein
MRRFQKEGTVLEEIVDIIDIIVEHDASRDVLSEAYALIKERDPKGPKTTRALAEICFLIARRCKEDQDTEQMRAFAQESYDIYKGLHIESIEDSAPILWMYLPSIMHEGVVKNEFDL